MRQCSACFDVDFCDSEHHFSSPSCCVLAAFNQFQMPNETIFNSFMKTNKILKLNFQQQCILWRRTSIDVENPEEAWLKCAIERESVE